jgi:UDP-N-acetylglucosamine 1-carboxyvinyltransferase
MSEQDSLIIQGLAGRKVLDGKIAVSGSKNESVAAFASTLLFDDPVALRNVPDLEDVKSMCSILESVGANITHSSAGEYRVDTSEVSSCENLDVSTWESLRASVVLSGLLLARCGKVTFPHPGGCVIGKRPIDMFLSGLIQVGADVKESERSYTLVAKGKLRGANIFFRRISVTGTAMLMMVAVLASGRTVLSNAAMEPEIVSLADFLISCGAKIEGAGTPSITVNGTGLLKSGKRPYTILPDRIEAGSFLILGALAARNLLITGCRPEHLGSLLEILRSAGVEFETGKDSMKIVGKSNKQNGTFSAVDISTHEYPGFATDLQAPMTVFSTQATGESMVHETVFERRLHYTEDLVAMNADIKMLDTHRVIVNGPTRLLARELHAPDLRAGLAYVLAATVAKGRSVIHNAHLIDRGYSKIEERLSSIGLDIERRAI